MCNQSFLCFLCFENSDVSDRVKCFKCKQCFHGKCVLPCLKMWTDSGKRKSTWICDGCDAQRVCDHSHSSTATATTPACDCDINSKLEIINVLSNDLSKAQKEICTLKETVRRLESAQRASRRGLQAKVPEPDRWTLVAKGKG